MQNRNNDPKQKEKELEELKEKIIEILNKYNDRRWDKIWKIKHIEN